MRRDAACHFLNSKHHSQTTLFGNGPHHQATHRDHWRERIELISLIYDSFSCKFRGVFLGNWVEFKGLVLKFTRNGMFHM